LFGCFRKLVALAAPRQEGRGLDLGALLPPSMFHCMRANQRCRPRGSGTKTCTPRAAPKWLELSHSILSWHYGNKAIW